MTIAASFTPKPAILSFAITHELLTMRLFLDSLANNNFRIKEIEYFCSKDIGDARPVPCP